MEDEFFNTPLQDVKRELRRGIIECQKRGLLQSAKWLSEMNHGLGDVNIDSENSSFSEANPMEGIAPTEYDNYFLAKSYFDVREYDRAAYFVRHCESPVPHFLHLYATYMSREKRKLDSTTDQSNLNDSGHVRDLADLLAMLRSEYSHSRLDGYGMYLYGVVLKALGLNQPAVQVLMQAIRAAPMLWGAYVELAPLVSEKEKLLTMHFGGHWMRRFFVAHTYIELYLNDEGLKAYEDLQSAGFRKCVYVTSQMALGYHNNRDVDKAIECFKALQEIDPYRLDNMDAYSNLLFVKEMKTEMAQLAHKAVGINKYSPETCCVIGNYYSIRSDHEMAIMYFQRALKLNPKYLAAWTLMGHEFMELKNTNAAIQSYRKAVEVNKRDYRAWYGLGQSYEILKMHYYSLYYFKVAHQLRPYDSRMLVALGETYEKLDKADYAIRCYWKAYEVGDIEGIAMYKLANIYEKLDEKENAVQCYMVYCEDERGAADKQSLYHGFMTLANYYEDKGQYDRASHYAYKCLESDDRKSEAKSLLKTIENKRSGKISDIGGLSMGSSSIASAMGAATTAATAGSNTITADTSSDDDMDMELSDYMLACRTGVTDLCSFKPNIMTSVTATESSATVNVDQNQTSASVDMSLNESAMVAGNSDASTSTAVATTAAVIAESDTNEKKTENNTNDETETPPTSQDDETNSGSHSMEISTISID